MIRSPGSAREDEDLRDLPLGDPVFSFRERRRLHHDAGLAHHPAARITLSTQQATSALRGLRRHATGFAHLPLT